jgi:hypothetical protein
MKEEKGDAALFFTFTAPLRKETAMPMQRRSPRRGFLRLPFAVSKYDPGRQVCFAYDRERNRIGCAPPARAMSEEEKGVGSLCKGLPSKDSQPLVFLHGCICECLRLFHGLENNSRLCP